MLYPNMLITDASKNNLGSVHIILNKHIYIYVCVCACVKGVLLAAEV